SKSKKRMLLQGVYARRLASENSLHEPALEQLDSSGIRRRQVNFSIPWTAPRLRPGGTKDSRGPASTASAAHGYASQKIFCAPAGAQGKGYVAGAHTFLPASLRDEKILFAAREPGAALAWLACPRLLSRVPPGTKAAFSKLRHGTLARSFAGRA